MTKRATFYFKDSLQDFLPKQQRKQPVQYSFSGKPTVKDAIEAQGVPHVEVAFISANGKAVDFNYWLMDGMEITVAAVAPAGAASLIPPAPMPPAFVLDVHLGKLARLLRLLGFDSLYERDYTDPQLADTAVQQNRILLTRDVPLLKYKKLQHGYWLRSQNSEEQLREVLQRYNLQEQLQPFTRCMVCNHLIYPVAKAQVLELLPPLTRRHFEEFYQCSHCKKVYWKGSHYQNMQRFLGELREND